MSAITRLFDSKISELLAIKEEFENLKVEVTSLAKKLRNTSLSSDSYAELKAQFDITVTRYNELIKRTNKKGE